MGRPNPAFVSTHVIVVVIIAAAVIPVVCPFIVVVVIFELDVGRGGPSVGLALAQDGCGRSLHLLLIGHFLSFFVILPNVLIASPAASWKGQWGRAVSSKALDRCR